MSVYSRPLVALSLSDADLGLLAYAALALKPQGCQEIRFAHVAAETKQHQSPNQRQSLLERMQAEVRDHFGPDATNVAFDVVAGERLDQLLSLAVQHQNDCIVLGHQREHSGRRSLARHLALLAPCSIWLVPEGSPCALRNILVPVDFSSHSRDALSLATTLAADNGLTSCRALHVFFDPSTIRYDEHIDEILGNEQAAMDKLIAGADCHGIVVERLLQESTHVPESILRVAAQHGTDLIVMSTHGRTRAASILLGSVTADTIATTSVPLLAVKHFGSHLNLFQALVNHRLWHQPALKSN